MLVQTRRMRVLERENITQVRRVRERMARREEHPLETRAVVRTLAKPASAARHEMPLDALAHRSPQPYPPPAPPQLNIESLTTQVIQQIDRRLVAYRERMGRI